MPNKFKVRETKHEREIRKRYEEAGDYVMRSAGSLGLLDLITMNKDGIRLIASQSVPWDMKKMKQIKRDIAKFRPPNSILLFFYVENNVERVIDGDSFE